MATLIHTPHKDADHPISETVHGRTQLVGHNWRKFRNQVSQALKASQQDQSDCEESFDRTFNTAIGKLGHRLRRIYEENCARKKVVIQQAKL